MAAQPQESGYTTNTLPVEMCPGQIPLVPHHNCTHMALKSFHLFHPKRCTLISSHFIVHKQTKLLQPVLSLHPRNRTGDPPPPEQSRAASSGHLDRIHFSEGRYFWNACHVANSGSPFSGRLQCNINTQSGTAPWLALALEMQLLCSQYSTVDYELQPHAQ